MLIVDDDLNIVTATPNADHWLGEIADGSPGLPDAVRSVVGCVKELHSSDTPDDRMPRARVRGASGRWLAIYASRTRQIGVRPHRGDYPGSQAIRGRPARHQRLRTVTT
jgi:hypothetical protein